MSIKTSSYKKVNQTNEKLEIINTKNAIFINLIAIIFIYLLY
jgi:hypothetical protein